jgi:hypothetical protein
MTTHFVDRITFGLNSKERLTTFCQRRGIYMRRPWGIRAHVSRVPTEKGTSIFGLSRCTYPAGGFKHAPFHPGHFLPYSPSGDGTVSSPADATGLGAALLLLGQPSESLANGLRRFLYSTLRRHFGVMNPHEITRRSALSHPHKTGLCGLRCRDRRLRRKW